MSSKENPRSLREVFEVGMDRSLPEFLEPPTGVQLNLGAGKKLIEGTIPLDADNGWRAPKIPYKDESVAAIHAYHFLEHLGKDDLLDTLLEIQRVLVVGGVLNVVVPHYSAEAAFQDLDHKTFWTESTWSNLFNNPYYDGTVNRDWRLEVASLALMGLVGRNLVIVSQLRKF